MGFSREELDETVRGAVLELAKAAALTGSDLYPCIQRLKAFHEILESGKTEALRRDRELEEVRLRDERVRNEAARRLQEENRLRAEEYQRQQAERRQWPMGRPQVLNMADHL